MAGVSPFPHDLQNSHYRLYSLIKALTLQSNVTLRTKPLTHQPLGSILYLDIEEMGEEEGNRKIQGEDQEWANKMEGEKIAAGSLVKDFFLSSLGWYVHADLRLLQGVLGNP